MKGKLKTRRKETIWGWIFVIPACMGLLIYIILPMIYSLMISFCSWDIISAPEFVGLKNYKALFTTDPHYMNSCWVTLKYTLIFVPSMLIITFVIALLLNVEQLKGKGLWRVLIYIPSIVPIMASSALWTFIYDPTNGLLNNLLAPFGIHEDWIFDKKMVLPCIAIMGIWGAGNTIMINLSGFGSIQQELYEAVDIDGGNWWARLIYVTLPMLSPLIFYNLVMALIGALQTFTQGYVMTNGGPENASNFYMLYLYDNAFNYNRMGLACAQSWLLFLVIALLTIFLFRTSGWVYYGGDAE